LESYESAASREKTTGPQGSQGPVPLEARGKSIFFGQILVEEGALSPDDLRRLIQKQGEFTLDERRAIGWLAVREGLITESELLALLDRHGWRLHLGELLVMRGHLSLKDLTVAMQEQGRSGELMGEIFLRLGLVSERVLAEGLAEQCGVAYVPIAHIPPNPELSRWVNASFARTHGLVPLMRRGRSLTVALWEPRSLTVIRDIEQATGLHVHVILTTRGEVEERLKALYEPASGQEETAA